MKKVFVVFSVLLLFIFTHFFIQFTLDYYDYQRTKLSLPISVENWEILEEGKDRYDIEVKYVYHFNNKDYHQAKIFKKKFMNSDLAFDYMKSLSEKKWKIWIDPMHPKISTLEKAFPFSQMIKSGLTLVIFIYFLFLKRYLFRKYSN